MRFSRKERERAQKNWRMWKKGKQWLCGAALFFTVVSSPGMLVLADEVNSGDATEVIAGEEAPPLSEGSTENEVEGVTEEDGMSSPEVANPNQQEENTPNTTENNETKVDEGKKERPKQGRLITSPTAINVIFPDANLAEVMRVQLNKTSVSDLVTQADLNGITTLSSNGNNFADISGMKHLINLTSLTLYNDQISDISELSGLTNLTSLRMDNNQISDISALSGLTNLTNLILANNQINDISVLAGLTNLTHLNLSNNQISNISTLAGLTNLTSLSLDYNQISDVNALSGLTNLTSLGLIYNQLSDISALSDMTNLISLSLSYNQISGVSALSDMTNLISLSLSNNQINDISALSGMTNLITLNFSRNQISDISPLSDLTNLTSLHMSNNQISDISLLNASQFTILSAMNQQIILSGIKWSNQLEMPFTVKDTEDNSEITPSSISNDGQFADGVITWNGLSNITQELSYSWNRYNTANRQFSGTVTLGVEPLEVKILVDTDGNSQTASDQTLFAEESDANWNSLEDMYTYVKEQLNGTDYGLLSVEQDSDDNYVILVSKVGSLKKEDADGTAVGTDIPFTPTYTITGTGDDAELVVSYDEVVIDPPTGYVYIYEKGTAQEVRYTEETSFAVPLTDTNSNGIPQWKEDYTVKQYKRAGALKPTTPGGSLVPGGTISIPDDAITGEIITVPDTIIGSDGREYGVDPSIDIDPTIPGVQVPLTDDEQDIPYFDILLSESTSESVEQSTSESIEQSTSESVEQSTSESIEQSTSESEEQSTSES
ncbi:hypothetical protein FHZ94_13890, partial [Listeria monocytogenes]|nr:hypothetical protein [Listeria monocytogenes]